MEAAARGTGMPVFAAAEQRPKEARGATSKTV